MADLGSPRGEVLEIDHVHVGAIAGREHAPVEETDGASGVARLALHREGKVEPAALAVARPERQQRRGEARVADRAHVRAAVGETDHGVGVREHLAGRVEVAVAVVEGRQVQERLPAVAQQHVVREVERSRPSRSARAAMLDAGSGS